MVGRNASRIQAQPKVVFLLRYDFFHAQPLCVDHRYKDVTIIIKMICIFSFRDFGTI